MAIDNADRQEAKLSLG